jgi:hypothetical protein
VMNVRAIDARLERRVRRVVLNARIEFFSQTQGACARVRRSAFGRARRRSDAIDRVRKA